MIATKFDFRPDLLLLSVTAILCLSASSLAAQVSSPAATEPTTQVSVSPAPEVKVAANSLADSAPAQHPDPMAGTLTEDQLKQMLLGKSIYLRGGYLDSSLNFNEHGTLTSKSAQGSYTLSGIEVTKIHLTKHKVELDAVRYGLHFLGAMPYEDPRTAVARVRITPAKKTMHISIDREVVVKPKKVHQKKKEAAKQTAHATSASAHPAPVIPPTSTSDLKEDQEKDDPEETASPEEQLKASIAAAPEAEKPADPKSVTTTTSPAHAAQVLKDALDKIFAPGLDDRMMATMPGFWKLYYQAVAAKSDYKPENPSVFRSNQVDKKARLLTKFEPPSNEFAQNAGVAGMALYHTVIEADGSVAEVAVARPIGFGLDESAVAVIRNAKFEPALKDGKAVPVLLDLIVQFRIFSHRTASTPTVEPAPSGNLPTIETEPKKAIVLPGPYSRQQ